VLETGGGGIAAGDVGVICVEGASRSNSTESQSSRNDDDDEWKWKEKRTGEEEDGKMER